MADNNNFRIAMRGYNKEDVNRFILEGDKLRREAEADLQEKIQQLSAERDDLRTALACANTDKQEIEGTLEEKINALVAAEETIAQLQETVQKANSDAAAQATLANDELFDLKKQLEEAKQEKNKASECQTKAEEALAQQQSQAAALSASLEEAKEEILHLKEQLLALENAPEVKKEDDEAIQELRIELELTKAELVKAQMENRSLEEQLATTPPTTVTDDALQNRLGEVILQANRTAEQIIREANNTAKLIKMGAVEEATVIKKNFEDKMQQRAERAERLLNELSEKYFAQFESTKNELATKVSEMIDEKQSELAEKVAQLQKETEEGLLLTDAQAAALMNG